MHKFSHFDEINFTKNKVKQFFSDKKRSLSISKAVQKIFVLIPIFGHFDFLKLFPIFDKLTFFVGIFLNVFIGGMLIFGQKSYLLGPTIFKISQPN